MLAGPDHGDVDDDDGYDDDPDSDNDDDDDVDDDDGDDDHGESCFFIREHVETYIIASQKRKDVQRLRLTSDVLNGKPASVCHIVLSSNGSIPAESDFRL